MQGFDVVDNVLICNSAVRGNIMLTKYLVLSAILCPFVFAKGGEANC